MLLRMDGGERIVSYCRWSTDDFRCDVYVYADIDGGWTTHVAGNRVVFPEPMPDPVTLPHPFDSEQWDAWWRRHQTVSAMVERATREPIGLPHDGETFNDPTPGECADRLNALAAAGYRVPAYVIADLREEEAEHV